MGGPQCTRSPPGRDRWAGHLTQQRVCPDAMLLRNTANARTAGGAGDDRSNALRLSGRHDHLGAPTARSRGDTGREDPRNRSDESHPAGPGCDSGGVNRDRLLALARPGGMLRHGAPSLISTSPPYPHGRGKEFRHPQVVKATGSGPSLSASSTPAAVSEAAKCLRKTVMAASGRALVEVSRVLPG
jgi:hypothetical protein